MHKLHKNKQKISLQFKVFIRGTILQPLITLHPKL